MSVRRLWIGGYTAETGGAARGIAVAELGADGTLAEPRLAAVAPDPSFVAQHPQLPVLYAVGEQDATLRAFAIGAGGALEAIGEPLAAGASACHVAVDPDGSFAVVACWGSGQVLVYPLDAATGAITARIELAPAVDPYPEIAEAPQGGPRVSRAHCSQFLADGRLVTTDLGFDLARVWRRSTGERPFEPDHDVAFPRGTGPRHVAAGPDGRLYVVGEDGITAHALAADAEGRYAIVASSPLRATPRERGEYAAHVSLSADGALVYATVRGSNVVAVLRVGADGALAPVAEVPSGGNWPRHHLVSGDRLYVANQLSDEITVFALGADGLPAGVLQSVAAGSPTALVPDAQYG